MTDKALDQNKLCGNCKHQSVSFFIGDVCGLGEGRFSGGSYTDCHTARRSCQPCGPDANLFERRIGVVERLLKIFWRKS